MDCPHCRYKTGWCSETGDDIDGEDGDFFTLPVKMERKVKWDEPQRETLYACPHCGKTFINKQF